MFDIGIKVVCIDDKFINGINDIFNALPVKGRMYTTRDIVPGVGFDNKETISVLLEELVNKPNLHGIEPGFLCSRFREPDELEGQESAHEHEPAVGHFQDA